MHPRLGRLSTVSDPASSSVDDVAFDLANPFRYHDSGSVAAVGRRGVEDPWVHEDHVAGITGESDGLNGDAEHIDEILQVPLLAVSAQVTGPEIP